MRQWNIDPTLMCRKHLLGEHVEMHMAKGSIEKNKSLNGFIKNGLLNVGTIKLRHDILADEIKRRGYNHMSIMLTFNEGHPTFVVDNAKNKLELCNRCPDCRRLIENETI